MQFSVVMHDDGVFITVGANASMPDAYMFVSRAMFPAIEDALREDRARRAPPPRDPEEVHGDA